MEKKKKEDATCFGGGRGWTPPGLGKSIGIDQFQGTLTKGGLVADRTGLAGKRRVTCRAEQGRRQEGRRINNIRDHAEKKRDRRTAAHGES